MIDGTKLAATIAIAAGGTLAGILCGNGLGGPVTIELTQNDLTMIGAVCGLLLALGGCCYASEFADACAKNQRQLTRLHQLVELATRDFRHTSQAAE